MADFKKLKEEMDPSGKFENKFISDLLGWFVFVKMQVSNMNRHIKNDDKCMFLFFVALC